MKHRFIVIVGLSGILLCGCKLGPAGQKLAAAGKTPTTQTATSPRPDSVSEQNFSGGFVPGNPEAFARFATAITYDSNKQTDAALLEFEKAANADPSNESLVVELARQFLAEKKTEKAVALLAKSADRPNASARLLSWYSRALLQAGKTSQAEKAGEKAVSRSPETLDGYQILAEIYSEKKQPDQVAKVLARAVKRVKEDAPNLVRLAELYNLLSAESSEVQAAADETARKLLKQALDLKPAAPALQRRIADAFHKAGDSKQAAAIYLKLLEAFSESPEMRDALREQLANIYLQSNDRSGAAQQLKAIVRDNPTRYPEAWYYLGILASRQKQFDDARSYFEKAILLNPKMEKAYYELAFAQADLQKPEEAIKTLDKAQELFRNTFGNEFFTGLVYARLKDYQNALKHYTAAEIIARAKEPSRLTEQFWFQVGSANERNKNYKEAEACFNRCLKLSPNFSEALNYLGYMWAERGEKLPQALELIAKALKNEPKNAAYLDSIGWVYFKMNKPQRALEFLLKSVERLEEPDPTVYDHLGDVYRALEQPDKARAAWEKALSIEASQDIKKKLEGLATLPQTPKASR